MVAALVLYVGVQFGSAYYRWFTFKDDVTAIALQAARQPSDLIVDGVMEAAQKRRVPVARDAVRVRQTKDHTYIDVEYVEPIPIVPTSDYRYPWTFAVKADGWHVKPATPSDVLGEPR